MMAIIKTERNFVYAYDPQPDDVFVRASLLGPGDEPGTRTPRHLRYLPITEYQGLVDWAVSMADQMAFPIHVLPLSYEDMLVPGRIQPFRDAAARMTDQQRGEMRALVVTTCAEVMRDCDDWQVRADAYNVLRQLKVIHHD
jgi:hypothetical protein